MSDETTTVDTGTATTDAVAGTTTTETAVVDTGTTDPTTTQVVAPVVPETYEITFPDGVTGDAALIEKTAATARELGLSNTQAQALLNFTATHANEQATKAAADALASFKPGGSEYTKLEQGWRDAVTADPTLGDTPEKLARSVEVSQKVLGTFGSPELQTFLHETGLGSHPAVLRLLTNIGKSMGEGTFITPTTAGGATRKSDAEVFFGQGMQPASET